MDNGEQFDSLNACRTQSALFFSIASSTNASLLSPRLIFTAADGHQFVCVNLNTKISTYDSFIIGSFKFAVQIPVKTLIIRND